MLSPQPNSLLDLAQGLTACPSATASFLAAAAQLAFTTATKADAGARGGAAGVGAGGVGFHAAVGGPALPTEVQQATYWQHDATAAAASQSVRFVQPCCFCTGAKSLVHLNTCCSACFLGHKLIVSRRPRGWGLWGEMRKGNWS